MSNRVNVTAVPLLKSNLSIVSPGIAKLAFILVKEWADGMVHFSNMFSQSPEIVNDLNDNEVARLFFESSENVIDSIRMGIMSSSRTDPQVADALIKSLKANINTYTGMYAALNYRPLDVSYTDFVATDFLSILFPYLDNDGDIEYALHVDTDEFEVFYVKENNLNEVFEVFSEFPLDENTIEELKGEDFYGTLYNTQTRNDDEPDFEIETAPEDENSEVIESLVARVYDIDDDLVQELHTELEHIDELISWGQALANIHDGTYSISKVITTTTVTVEEIEL